MRHLAYAISGNDLVEVLSVNEGIALCENVDGVRRDVEYSTLESVWPNSTVLDNFDELAKSFTPEGVVGFIEVLTGSPEWACLVATKWAELY